MPLRTLLLRSLARKALLRAGLSRPAWRLPGAERTGRLSRCADGGTEIHQGLCEIAGPVRRHDGQRVRGHSAAPCRHRCLQRMQPAHHPFDIAIDGCRDTTEGNGRHRRSRVGPDARQIAQRRFRVGKPPAMPRHDHLRAGMKVARAAVVSQPRPGVHDGLGRRGRQRLHIGETREESREIGLHRLHRRLLQHDLRQPDPVRIGPLDGLRPPWQLAPVPVIPDQQIRSGSGVHTPWWTGTASGRNPPAGQAC